VRNFQHIGIGLVGLLFLASCVQPSAAELPQRADKSTSFKSAILTARAIQTPKLKFLALLAIAKDLATVSDSVRASKLLAEAEAYALSAEPSWRDFHLAGVAKGFAKIGNAEKASAVIAKIQKEQLRQKAQAAMALSYAKLGLLSKAYDQIVVISDSLTRAEAWFNIAAIYAEQNRNKGALEFESILQNEAHKAELLSKVAENFAESGQLKDAAQLISELKMLQGKNADELTETKVDLLLSVADASRKFGKNRSADELLEEAGRLAKTAWYSEVRAKTLTKVTFAYFKAGNENKGLFFLTLAWEAARTCQNPVVRIFALAHVLYHYDRLGKKTDTFWAKYKLLRTFKSMERHADQARGLQPLPLPYDPPANVKAQSLILTASRFAALGHPAFTKLFLSETPEQLRPQGLARVADGYLIAGDFYKAKKVALQAKKEVKWAYFPSTYFRGEAKLEIVTVLARVGEQSEAEALANSITSQYFRAKALSKIARFSQMEQITHGQITGH